MLKKDNALDEAQQQLKKEIPSLLVASQEISPEGEKIPANAHTGFLPAQWNF